MSPEPTMSDPSFDATFVLKLFGIMGVGVVLTIIGFIIVGAIAFRRKDEKAVNAFVELFSRGDVLRLLTVAGILASVLALAFAKLVEGAVAASILSGIAGYVLGGLSKGGTPKNQTVGKLKPLKEKQDELERS